MDLVTPHLKNVLKNYQNSATRSLQGPDFGPFLSTAASYNHSKKGLIARYHNSSLTDANDNTVVPPVTAADTCVATSISNSAINSITTSSTIVSNSNSINSIAHNCTSKSPIPVITTTITTADTTNSLPVSTQSIATVVNSEHNSKSFNNKKPLPLPFQVPILAIADTSRTERAETIFEGESIACFEVGGEKRLCLPQVLNSVLNEFNVFQINKECDNLQIYCSICTPEQLNELKDSGDLPCSAPSCGLIKRTDAFRLASALLYSFPFLPTKYTKEAFSSSFKVYHECFGKGYGLCLPSLFINRSSKCIECLDCCGMFSFEHFVSHAHKNRELMTVHWGFDSMKWRYYLKISKDQNSIEKFAKILDLIYENYENSSIINCLPIHAKINELIGKRKISGHYPEPYVKSSLNVDAPLKKRKVDDSGHLSKYMYPTSLDPFYIQQMLEWPNNRTTGLRHITAHGSPFSKEYRNGQYPTFGISNSASCLNLSMRYTDTPQLQNSDKVVPISEVQNFQNNFQPNVSLVPLPRIGSIAQTTQLAATTVITSMKPSQVPSAVLPRRKQFFKNYTESVSKKHDTILSSALNNANTTGTNINRNVIPMSNASETETQTITQSTNSSSASFSMSLSSPHRKTTWSLQSNTIINQYIKRLRDLLETISDSNLRLECLDVLKKFNDFLLNDLNCDHSSDDDRLIEIKSEPVSDDGNNNNNGSLLTQEMSPLNSNSSEWGSDVHVKTEDEV